MIPHEAAGLAGLAVLGFIGEKALKGAGQADMAQYLSIIITVAGGIITVKMFWEGVARALAVVGVFL
ncbi:hypothetical protein MO973_19490 [Paenibacillus sp. TRM 82003]|nr:hypothetical protein [Paenibacillus sp. TRM 82003]